jgi:prophage maintenance system killer protein
VNLKEQLKRQHNMESEEKLTEIYELFIKIAKSECIYDGDQKRLEILGNVFIHLSDLEFERENQNKRTESIEQYVNILMNAIMPIFSEKGKE